MDSSDVSHNNVKSKFYLSEDAETDACVGRSSSDERTIEVRSEEESVHILISNTDTSVEATGVWAQYRIVQDVVFQAPGGHAGANFGESITVVGDNILIGASNHNTDAGQGAGQAHLYDSLGNLLQSFMAPDGKADAWFGWSVAAVGEHILVGAPFQAIGDSWEVGQAYLFDADGTHLQTFTPPNTESDTWFGFAVAGTQDTILISAFDVYGSGRVLQYNLEGDLIRTLEAPDAVQYAAFGSSVATDGEHILIGARYHPSTEGHGTGRAYIFDFDGNHVETLTPPEEQADAHFGWDVAIADGGYLVGAPRQETSVVASDGTPVQRQTGQAFLFDSEGGLLSTYEANDPQTDSRFGSTLATVGENILIGAEQYDIDDDANAGQVYAFAPSGGYIETLQAPEVQTGSWFGRSLASIGDSILVGAHNHNTDAGDFSGEAYLFAR